MAPGLKQIFYNPASRRSLPVFVQDDVPLELLQPLRALLQNYGAECFNYPHQAAVIVVANARTSGGQALIQEYSVEDPELGKYGRAVLSKNWIIDCIEADAFLGPPTWGGHFMRKAATPTPATAGTPDSLTLASTAAPTEVSCHSSTPVTSKVAVAPSSDKTDSNISHVSSLVSEGSSGSSTVCSVGGPSTSLPPKPEVGNPPARSSKKKPRPLGEPGGAGMSFSETDDCVMIDFILNHWDEWKRNAGKSFWKQFNEQSEVGKTRSGKSWAKRFKKLRKRFLKVLGEKEDGEVDELDEVFGRT